MDGMKTSEHPLWPRFKAWADENIPDLMWELWWLCWLDGAAVGRETDTLLKNVRTVQLPPPPVPPARPPVNRGPAPETPAPFWGRTDLDVLQTACDNFVQAVRLAAMEELTARIAAGRCDPAVALVKGVLGKLDVGNSLQADRRGAVLRAVRKYNLELRFWF
jgi:hypothetical protein